MLKWVGGKRQLLPQLRRFYPARFNRYIEPFFGSGAVFFDLQRAGRLRGKEAVLVDSNPDLVGCYESVRDQPQMVASALERLADAHSRVGRAFYYEVRDTCFNPQRAARRLADGRIDYSPELAAMLIYLNRTGFNGLFRVNASGAFNVPAGRYDRPAIPGRDRLFEIARALAGERVQLLYAGFEAAGELATADDFLYIDPPYAPMTRTANFTAYTTLRFDAGDHARLQRLVIALARRGCHVLLSNSTAAEITALYDTNPDAREAGLTAYRVSARRAVNSNASGRGPVDEYLITNIEWQDGTRAGLPEGMAEGLK